MTDPSPTNAELLKPLGYATCQFGKNHLGTDYSPLLSSGRMRCTSKAAAITSDIGSSGKMRRGSMLENLLVSKQERRK